MPKAFRLSADEQQTTCGLTQLQSSLKPFTIVSNHTRPVSWRGSELSGTHPRTKGACFFRRSAPAGNTADRKGSPERSHTQDLGRPFTVGTIRTTERASSASEKRPSCPAAWQDAHIGRGRQSAPKCPARDAGRGIQDALAVRLRLRAAVALVESTGDVPLQSG